MSAPPLEKKMLERVTQEGYLPSSYVCGKERAALNRLFKKGLIKREPWQRCFMFLPDDENNLINKYVYFIGDK